MTSTAAGKIPDSKVNASSTPTAREATEVPFAANAAAQWLPAIEQADAYAKSLGYSRVEYVGTGRRVRSLEVVVEPIQVYNLIVVKADGSRHTVGGVLPEGKIHLGSLKSTATLIDEFKGLIDAFHRKQETVGLTLDRLSSGSVNVSVTYGDVGPGQRIVGVKIGRLG